MKKSDMVHNGATPKIDVDPETYVVRADGELLVCEPAISLPLTQRYFCFERLFDDNTCKPLLNPL